MTTKNEVIIFPRSINLIHMLTVYTLTRSLKASVLLSVNYCEYLVNYVMNRSALYKNKTILTFACP